MMDRSTRFGIKSVIAAACFISAFTHEAVRYEIGNKDRMEDGRDVTLSKLWKSFLKREAIKHNHYQCLMNRHLELIHSRQKRGWINEDFNNRATNTPSPTTTSTPPPPIFGGSTGETTQVTTVTTGSTTQSSTSMSQSTNTTETMTPTTEGSSAALPQLCFHCLIGSLTVLCIHIFDFL